MASTLFMALPFEVAHEVDHLRLWNRHIGAVECGVERRMRPSDALRSISGTVAILVSPLIGAAGDAKRFRNEHHGASLACSLPVIVAIREAVNRSFEV
jgi:hypothetical protein